MASSKAQKSAETGRQGVTPVEVIVSDQDDVLYITWSDEHQGVYPWEYLRGACPCAVCKGSHRPVDIGKVKPAEGVELIDYLHVGAYAFRMIFSDAHDTGIYTYEYLRALCQCEKCVQSRASV